MFIAVHKMGSTTLQQRAFLHFITTLKYAIPSPDKALLWALYKKKKKKKRATMWSEQLSPWRETHNDSSEQE